MKRYKELAALFLSVLLVLSCVGCAAITSVFEDPQLRTNTEDMLDAFLADDAGSAYALVADAIAVEDFDVFFRQVRTLLAEVDSYELRLISIYHNSSITDGDMVKTSTAAYRMTTASGDYVVDVQSSSAYKSLSSFRITPYEATDHYFTGTLESLKGANVAQWLVLLSNVVSIGVVILAVVDCCRSKPKAKAAWIAVCLLGFLSVGATIGASMLRFNFNISWLFGYSAYICYGGGTRVIRLLLPVGAVIYFLVGRRSVQEPVESVEVTEDPLTVEAGEGMADDSTTQEVHHGTGEDEFV